MNEYWALFDNPTDDEPSHEATVTLSDYGYRVQWWNVNVGLVTAHEHDTLADAYDSLENSGYVFIGDLEDEH